MLVLLPVLFSVSAQERIFQLWNLNRVQVALSEKTKIGVTEKVHFTPHSGNIDLKLGDVTIKRSINPWFEAGVAGRILMIRKDYGWLQENRPMVFGDISKKLGRLGFGFSNRFEYRMFKHVDDHFRYRQMFSVELPPFVTPRLIIYAAEEGFIKFNDENLHIARLYAGTKLKCSRIFEMRFYYVLEKSKELDFWNTSDVVGMNLSLDF